MGLRIADWKYGKEWVYSITYDEALTDLHRFAVPFHEEYGIPGHVEVVAGHIGKLRQLGQSSYNGYYHMDAAEMCDLLARGWGIGNHSWSHELIGPDMVDREIGEAKQVIEEAVGAVIPLYCAPGNNANMSDHVLAACRKYGYLGAMSITDALNRPGEELFWLNRTALHDQYYEPFYSEFDPYRNIRNAQEKNGWIIDYCHCPLEQPVHRNKDCSEKQLSERFEAVLSEGGDRVWCANPDEVIYYHTLRRQSCIEDVVRSEDEHKYRLLLSDDVKDLPQKALTFEADVPAAWCQMPSVWVNDRLVSAEVIRPRVLGFTLQVQDKMEFKFGPTKIGAFM
jgi:hypothetical protein